MRATATCGRRRAGFTLVEVLVVMSIVAVLGMLTALAMSSIGRRSAREGAREAVMGVLRQAQLAAVDSGRGALVRIDPRARTICGVASTVIAAWHFEQADGGITPGAKRMNATLLNFTAGSVAPGAVGLALEFDGNDDYVDCGNYPVYDQTTGIRLEAWVKPAVAADMGIMCKTDGAGAGYALGLDAVDADSDGVDDSLGLDGGVSVKDAHGNKVNLYLCMAGEPYIQPDTWHHVALEFDGLEARLFLDGHLVDLDSFRQPEDAVGAPNPVPDPNTTTDEAFAAPALLERARGNALEIGRCPNNTGGTDYFEGQIDEPRLLSVAGGNPLKLPERVPMVVSENVIHFDSEGRLDIAYHSRPVRIALGDPYQAVPLVGDNLTYVDVANVNPFPTAGGFVIIGNDELGYEAVRYASTNGLRLEGVTDLDGNNRTVAFAGTGIQVFFARLVEVDTMGTVRPIP